MKMYKWISVMDEQTCNDCLVRHNRIFSKTQLNRRGWPPLHGPKNQKGKIRGYRCTLEKLKKEEGAKYGKNKRHSN